MKGICKENTAQNLDLNKVTNIPNQEHTFPLTIEKEYLIMAIGINKKTSYPHYLIDDERTPFWMPYELFKISDEAFPPNWHIDVIDKNKSPKHNQSFLSGFYELCADENFYNALADGDSKALDAYWKRKNEFQQWYVEREAGRKLYQKEARIYYSINDREYDEESIRQMMVGITIAQSRTYVDVEKVKRYVIDEWQSGNLYKYYYHQGIEKNNLYSYILTDLSDFTDTIFDPIILETRKKFDLPNAYLDCRKNYPKSDIRSIGFEALRVLDNGLGTPIEELTTDDIPIILEFLNTRPGKSLEAWEKWETYWANLDYTARRKKLLETDIQEFIKPEKKLGFISRLKKKFGFQ